jgi:peptide/nickel transport system permease protein
MISFLARRIAWTFVVLYFVLSATFLMLFLLPADPAKTIAGPHADAETIAKIRADLHLDDPLLTQYGSYMLGVLQGDFGRSYRTDEPVTDIIGRRLPNTMYLAFGAMLFQLLIGVPIGLYTALRAGKPADVGAMALALVGISAPTFLVGLMLMYFLGYRHPFFPIGGGGEGFVDILYHAILPSLTLGISGAAYYSRLTRGEYLDVATRDYMRTARAKGLAERRVILKHGLRNALLPLVTFAGLDLGVLLGGAIVTEYIFSWPGLGHYAVQSIFNQDMPVVMGTVMVGALMIVLANLLVDLLYAWLDPRIRLG